MSTFKAIRERLGVTQSVLAVSIGCTQGNVSFYEKGQTVPPDTAKRLIEYAKTLGYELTFNDIYAYELPPAPVHPAQAATETVADEVVQHAPTGALRTGTVRRYANRRAQDGLSELDRRAKNGPPFQSFEHGEA